MTFLYLFLDAFDSGGRSRGGVGSGGGGMPLPFILCATLTTYNLQNSAFFSLVGNAHGRKFVVIRIG